VIALISDVHGNFPALQAVMAHIEMSGCEKIISLGDVAGYYCQINECIDLLREKSVINVMGNHDHYIVNNQPCPRSRSANDCLDYQRKQTTPQNMAWLENSAPRMDSGAESFVHGGWKDVLDEYLFDIREDYFSGEKARFFFSGHTHIQSLKVMGEICYCNPGSVGQPRDCDPRAAFAFFDGTKIYLRRIDYDIDKIAVAMERCGFGRHYYQGLYNGTGIGEIKGS
jgi:predicted phosphodiesterase